MLGPKQAKRAETSGATKKRYCVPESAVRPGAGNIDELPLRFGVSGEAMAWRLYNFELAERLGE